MTATLTERFRFFSPARTESPFHVVGFTGVEGLHRLFDFHIDLVCADAAVDTGKLLAAPCRFEVLRDGDAAPAVFSGYPAQVEQRGFFNGYAYYAVHLRPTFWKLSQIRQSAIFLGKKLEDVLRELLSSQPFFQFPHEFRLTDGGYPAPEFAMQYQESLYEYICWRMEEQGAYFYFEERNGTDTVVFADAPQSHSADDAPPLSYAPASGLEGDRREEVVVSFSLAQTPLPRRVALRNYDWRNPGKVVVGMADVDVNGLGDVYLSNEYVDNDADAARLATIRAQELRCRARLFRGASSAPMLRPGRVFRLDRHYNDAFNRDYLVTEITHEGRQDAYLSLGLGIPLRDAAERLYYRNAFTCMEADVPYRPARTARRNHISGVLRAFVAGDGSGARAETDEYGRYKLTFPFDISGRTGGNASCWIRRAQPQVGRDSGLSLPLQPGTEVLVSFVDGNPDLPVIAGALANGETGSVSGAGNVNFQGLRTPGGNQITINDTDNKQGISLATAAGSGLTVAAGSAESALLTASHITQVAGACGTQLASFGLSQLSGFKVSSGAFRFDKDAYWPALCAALSDSAGAVMNTLASQTEDKAKKDDLNWGTSATQTFSTLMNALGDVIVARHTAPIPYGGSMVAEDDMAKTLLQVSASSLEKLSALIPYIAGRLTSVLCDTGTAAADIAAATPALLYRDAVTRAVEALHKKNGKAEYASADPFLDCGKFSELSAALADVIDQKDASKAEFEEILASLKKAHEAYCQKDSEANAYYRQQRHESERAYLVDTVSSLIPEFVSLHLFHKAYNPDKKLGGILLRARDRNITLTAQDAIAMHAQRGFLRNTRDLPEVDRLSDAEKKKNPSGDTDAALGRLETFPQGEKAENLDVLGPYSDLTPVVQNKLAVKLLKKAPVTSPTRAGMDAAAYWGVKINAGSHATDFMSDDIDGIHWFVKDSLQDGEYIRKRGTFIADTTELDYKRNRWAFQRSEENAYIIGDQELSLKGGHGAILLAKETGNLPAVSLTTTHKDAMIYMSSQDMDNNAPSTDMALAPSGLTLGFRKKKSDRQHNAFVSLEDGMASMAVGECGVIVDEDSAMIGNNTTNIACFEDEIYVTSDSVFISGVQVSKGKVVGAQNGILEVGGAIKITGAAARGGKANAGGQYASSASEAQSRAQRICPEDMLQQLQERIEKLENNQQRKAGGGEQ